MFTLSASAPSFTFTPTPTKCLKERTVIDLALRFDCGASIAESDYSAPSSPRSAASVAGDDDLILFGKAPAPAPAAAAPAAPAPAAGRGAAQRKAGQRKAARRKARGPRPATNTLWDHVSKQWAKAERSKPQPQPRPLATARKPKAKKAQAPPAPAAATCPYPPTSLEANRWYKAHGRR